MPKTHQVDMLPLLCLVQGGVAQMWIQAEQIFIRLGIFAALLDLLAYFYLGTFPKELRALYIDDGPIAVVIGLMFILAVFGLLLLFVNLVLGRSSQWASRLANALFFGMGFAGVAASGI